MKGFRRLVVASAIVVTGMGLAAPPAGAAPTVTVTPGPTGLLDQQVVRVQGSGYVAGAGYLVTQCRGAVPAGCALDPPVNANGATVTANPNGVIEATLRLPRVLTLPSGDVDCSAAECAVVVLTTGNEERARVVLDFEPTGTAPAPPDATLSIAVPQMRANGAPTATWTGAGYYPWFRASQIDLTPPLSIGYIATPGAYVALCTPPPGGWAGCERFVTPLTLLPGSSGAAFRFTSRATVRSDGTVSEPSRSVPRMWDTNDGRIDCAVADCGIALEQDGRPHSNVVDIAWAPEWAPYPSATAFVSAAYTKLLGRAPTTSERTAAVANLTDRAVTGFELLLDLAGRTDARRLAEITRLYQAALGRPPDGPGLLYWEGELERTGSMAKIAEAFGRTAEFKQSYGPSVTNAQTVTTAYQRTLGRDPSASERTYWVGRLQAGLARTHMIHLFSRTPEYLAREDGRSRAAAITVALLGRGPTSDEWMIAGPDFWWRNEYRDQDERVDDWVLSVLSSDQLVAAVG